MALTLTPAQRRDWLRLSLSENVGPVTFRQLIERFGDATAAIAALPELSRKGGLSRPLRLYGEVEAETDLEHGESFGAQAVAGTIAALAGGIDSVYPPENGKLQEEIGERGLLVSEMKPGTTPRAEHFPRRNLNHLRHVAGNHCG